jgi:hypothetical protein
MWKAAAILRAEAGAVVHRSLRVSCWTQFPKATQLNITDAGRFHPHAIAPGLPFELEGTPAGFAPDEGEAQEAKALRFAKPTPSAPVRRIAIELGQAGLFRMERQRKLLQPLAHRILGVINVELSLPIFWVVFIPW